MTLTSPLHPLWKCLPVLTLGLATCLSLINGPAVPLMWAAAWKHVFLFLFLSWTPATAMRTLVGQPACSTRETCGGELSCANPRPARPQPTQQLMTDSWACPAGSVELPGQWPVGWQEIISSYCFKFGDGMLTQTTDITTNIYPLPGFTYY